MDGAVDVGGVEVVAEDVLENVRTDVSGPDPLPDAPIDPVDPDLPELPDETEADEPTDEE